MKKIDVKKHSGEIINVEVICYFEVVNLNKKYLFYTLNETVENDLVKMYVAEAIDVNNAINIGQKMTDEEWTNLKSIMKSILTGGTDENIKYLEIEGV